MSAENQVLFGSKCSFSRPVGRPLDGRSTCPRPQYLRHWRYCLYKPPFLLMVMHGFRLRHYTAMQVGAAVKSVLCLIVEAQIASRCRVWHVFCHQRPARISLLLFLGVATTSKGFQWYLVHDVTTVSLRLVLSFFSL